MSDPVAGPLTVRSDVTIPAAELTWRFSRSAGPGGQSVNTTDSRVELVWDALGSRALNDRQKERIADRLGHRMIAGCITVRASENRSQWQNRQAARTRLAALVRAALAPPPRRRRRSRPTRGSVERRIQTKKIRSTVKRRRRRPSADD